VGGSGSASGDGSSVSPTLLAGADHDRESDAYQDEAYAFFLNCFHLKDWEEARCVQARDRVHARVDVISGSEGASSALDRSGVNVSCVPRGTSAEKRCRFARRFDSCQAHPRRCSGRSLVAAAQIGRDHGRLIYSNLDVTSRCSRQSRLLSGRRRPAFVGPSSRLPCSRRPCP